MKNITILKTEILANFRYILRKITYEATRSDGTTSVQEREAYDRGNGATVLLYNKAQQTVVLIKQFRLPTLLNGNPSGMLIESCAGLLDKDNPEECIKREIEEETGYKIDEVKKVMEVYMSPGSVTEILYFFVAEYHKDLKLYDGGGLEEENEDIEVLELPFKDALEMVKTGEIKDAKTIMLLQYAEINRLIG
ncbi:GDP-mannose pyrophosphatase NudK [Mucilaginibacter celer]|uniref:GDP-mannose pyrophosphatase n=1 Tax=Mucilaginibacter celer TaxID=2305508 RepID=A0A494VPC4_9SPHI|nr:GDP-mannose pyrophosphatase NudK [Mucilaginibacter celer]AYL94980.1 GDP-mannose pyrophosphatase NudK [Mucilaginibacter celer]